MQTTTAKKSILESPPWNSDYRRLCGLFPLGLKLQYWKSSFPLWMCGVGLGSTVAKDAWNKTLTFASIHCDNFYSAPFEVVPCTNDVVTKKIEKVPQSICKIVLRHDICQKNYTTGIFEATILHKNTRKSRQNSVNASKYTIYDKRWTWETCSCLLHCCMGKYLHNIYPYT